MTLPDIDSLAVPSSVMDKIIESLLADTDREFGFYAPILTTPGEKTSRREQLSRWFVEYVLMAPKKFDAGWGALLSPMPTWMRLLFPIWAVLTLGNSIMCALRSFWRCVVVRSITMIPKPEFAARLRGQLLEG